MRTQVATEAEPITRVIFRVWKGKDAGDVIALFPEIDEGRGLISSYMHIGQHGGADYGCVIRQTRPATEAEYAPLKRELEGAPYGYRLQVRRRR